MFLNEGAPPSCASGGNGNNSVEREEGRGRQVSSTDEAMSHRILRVPPTERAST